jgi:hypothetical protein
VQRSPEVKVLWQPSVKVMMIGVASRLAGLVAMYFAASLKMNILMKTNKRSYHFIIKTKTNKQTTKEFEQNTKELE